MKCGRTSNDLTMCTFVNVVSSKNIGECLHGWGVPYHHNLVTVGDQAVDGMLRAVARCCYR